MRETATGRERKGLTKALKGKEIFSKKWKEHGCPHFFTYNLRTGKRTWSREAQREAIEWAKKSPQEQRQITEERWLAHQRRELKQRWGTP